MAQSYVSEDNLSLLRYLLLAARIDLTDRTDAVFGLDDDKKRDKHYARGDWDKVIEIGLRQLKTAPYDVKVLNDLAVAYYRSDMEEEAFKICRKIFSIEPDPDLIKQSMTLGPRFMRYYIVLAEIYYNRGEIQKALDIFQKLKPMGKHFSDKFKFSAKIYLQINDVPSAVEELRSMYKLCDHRRKTVVREVEALVKSHPHDDVAQRLLYDVYKSQGLLNGALRDLDKEVSKNPLDAGSLLTLSYFLHFSGHSSKAVESLTRHRVQGGAAANLELALGSIQSEMGEYESAADKLILVAKTASELRPLALRLLLQIAGKRRLSDETVLSTARILEEMGNTEGARNLIESLAAGRADKKAYDAYLGKLAANEVDKAFQRGDLEKAHRALKQLLEVQPEDEPARKKLADVESLLDRKKIEEREELLRRGMLAAEQEATLSMELASLYLSRPGMEDKAIAHLQNAARHNTPSLPAILLRLGSIFLSRDLTELALKNFDKAASCEAADQQRKETLYSIAAALEEKGLFEKAMRYYGQVADIDASYKDVMGKLDALAESVPREEQRSASQTAVSTIGGRYSQLVKIGEGGMGSVYKAFDLILKRPVALKIIREELRRDEESAQRFLREAQSASQLRHPGIITIFDIVAGDELTIVMEFIEGQNLRVYMKKGRFNAQLTLKLAAKICDPLLYAHTHGIIHRDIKPDNIMVQKGGEVKIADFGLAHFGSATALTSAGQALGTPWYMPPEQIMGKPVDQRGDIYSLGATLYELSTAKVPFPDGNVAYRQIHEQPAPPRKIAPSIPASLEKIIMRCLEKEPERRYQSAKELKAEAMAALAG